MDRWRLAGAAAFLLFAGCTPGPAPTSVPPSPSASAGPAVGEVVPAPGSDSRIYPPNPAALVVAIDPGHGGCLDWGVPNPYDNSAPNAEKTLTLGIALRLRDLLEADGVTVVMTRDADIALAGDLYPELGCHGDPFRDVNGDGLAGFGPDYPEATRTRDELSARIDLANLARAQALVSIHINSLTENGVVYPIAATQTYYSDERPWGPDGSLPLATALQDAVVAELAAAVPYERQDRGLGSVNYYILAPPEAGEVRQPTRGSLMPAVLAEVASMSLEAESVYLATAEGQQVIAQALFNGLADWFAGRTVGARMDALVSGGEAGVTPAVIGHSGPPFWPAALPSGDGAVFQVRLTNTGTAAWHAGVTLVAGWQETADPYLDGPPTDLRDLLVAVPALGPGESVILAVDLGAPPSGIRQVAWISLRDAAQLFANGGMPPLLLAAP